jgi:hypothetical protein
LSEPSSAAIETALVRLETSIRQLKVQYDMFFCGALPRQPHELRARVERMIKQYTNAPIRKYAHRFHFNALVGRYNSFSELWGKTLRTLEEGERNLPERHNGEKLIDRCRIHDPIEEQERLRTIHARYLEARNKLEKRGGKLPFEAFVKGIATQAERLRQKSACDEIELRLVVSERKVHLKARPGR